MTKANQMFVNMQVKDLERTREFWEKIGFEFNPQFSNNDAACLVIGENLYAMLMTETSMKRFTKKPMADTKKTNEVLTALSFDSKSEVIEVAKKAVRAGGKLYRPEEDYGWMFTQAIEDPDGHVWELFYINEEEAAEAMEKEKKGAKKK